MRWYTDVQCAQLFEVVGHSQCTLLTDSVISCINKLPYRCPGKSTVWGCQRWPLRPSHWYCCNLSGWDAVHISSSVSCLRLLAIARAPLSLMWFPPGWLVYCTDVEHSQFLEAICDHQSTFFTNFVLSWVAEPSYVYRGWSIVWGSLRCALLLLLQLLCYLPCTELTDGEFLYIR